VTFAQDTSDHVTVMKNLAVNNKQPRKNSFDGTRPLYPCVRRCIVVDRVLLTCVRTGGEQLRKFVSLSEAGAVSNHGPSSSMS
jgi:hypothetical protein